MHRIGRQVKVTASLQRCVTDGMQIAGKHDATTVLRCKRIEQALVLLPPSALPHIEDAGMREPNDLDSSSRSSIKRHTCVNGLGIRHP